jgi:hypothetical protein
LRTRAGKDLAEGLLMDVPDDEVPAAIDDAAHNVAIRMHARRLKRVSATNSSNFAHVVCLAQK